MEIQIFQTLKAQLGLNEDQIREFKDAFDIFDEDASGTVSTGELASVMRTLGQDIDEKEVGIMISEVDSDGNYWWLILYYNPALELMSIYYYINKISLKSWQW